MSAALLLSATGPVSAFSANEFLEIFETSSGISNIESSLVLAQSDPERKKSVSGLQRRLKEEKRRVEKIVKSLRPLALKVQQRQDVNICDGKGRTLLMEAARIGCGEAIDYLLGENAELGLVDKSGRTALSYDETEGSGLLAVRLCAELDLAFSAEDFTKIQKYCKFGIAPDIMLSGGPLVGKLLQAGKLDMAVDVCRGKKMKNEEMHDGTLISELIIASGNADMIRIGAAALGRELWKSSPGGADALLLILRRGDLAAVQFYAHHFGFGNNLSTLVVRYSSPEVVTWVLKQSGAVGKVDSWGSYPLFEAARRGDIPVYDAVLAAGADVAARNEKGETLLMHAALGGNVQLVNAVLEKLPPELQTATDNAGRTAADYARMSGVAMVESLLATRGLKPQAK